MPDASSRAGAPSRDESVWQVNRLYLRPDGSYFSRPLGKWRARSRDDAIEKAAHEVRCLAVL